jgi:hypothetical protein
LTCWPQGISSGQLYTWRKQFRTDEVTGFIPVTVGSDPVAQLPPPRRLSMCRWLVGRASRRRIDRGGVSLGREAAIEGRCRRGGAAPGFGIGRLDVSKVKSRSSSTLRATTIKPFQCGEDAIRAQRSLTKITAAIAFGNRIDCAEELVVSARAGHYSSID